MDVLYVGNPYSMFFISEVAMSISMSYSQGKLNVTYQTVHNSKHGPTEEDSQAVDQPRGSHPYAHPKNVQESTQERNFA